MLEQMNDLKINIVSFRFKKLEKEQFKPKASKKEKKKERSHKSQKRQQ